MAREDRSKKGLARLQRQKQERLERAKGAEASEPEPTKTTPTSFWLERTLINDLDGTKQALRRETGDRGKYTSSMLVRAMMAHFVQMEMDDQIKIVDSYLKANPAVTKG